MPDRTTAKAQTPKKALLRPDFSARSAKPRVTPQSSTAIQRRRNQPRRLVARCDLWMPWINNGWALVSGPPPLPGAPYPRLLGGQPPCRFAVLRFTSGPDLPMPITLLDLVLLAVMLISGLL